MMSIVNVYQNVFLLLLANLDHGISRHVNVNVLLKQLFVLQERDGIQILVDVNAFLQVLFVLQLKDGIQTHANVNVQQHSLALHQDFGILILVHVIAIQ